VFVYFEKHDIYICGISNGKVRSINFYGEDIFIDERVISYSSYQDKSNGVAKIVSLDSLDVVEEVDLESAIKRGIKPKFYQNYKLGS